MKTHKENKRNQALTSSNQRKPKRKSLHTQKKESQIRNKEYIISHLFIKFQTFFWSSNKEIQNNLSANATRFIGNEK